MRKLAVVVASLAFIAASCGGDGDGGGGDQGDVADKLIEAADDQDLTLDEDCVREKASRLSDDDADKILAAEGSEDPELSPEGEALTAELFDCISLADNLDTILEQIPDDGTVDKDCLRDKLESMDMSEFTAGGDSPELISAMTECMSLGG